MFSALCHPTLLQGMLYLPSPIRADPSMHVYIADNHIKTGAKELGHGWDVHGWDVGGMWAGCGSLELGLTAH